MKKKLIGMSVLAAAMTMAISVPAFAGWVQEREGWVYYYDGGGQAWCGWFTDPADGAMYYIDPDGYMMSETRVEGYWLGADGRRVDKTQEEIQREAERAVREANRPSPSKGQAAANSAAAAAKSATAAASTTRLSYQAEMKVFMDKYYLDTAKVLTNTSVRSGTTNNNIEQSYRFDLVDQNNIISTSLWTVSLKNSENYTPEAAGISYNRSILTEETDLAQFDNLFKQLTIAAIGDTTGDQLYNYLFEQLNAGNYNFEVNGNTDSGNYYTLSCGNGVVTIKVTCSEVTENTVEAESAETETQEQDTAESATEQVTTSSVIVAGANSDTNVEDDE